jgi:hypothetical protein
MTYKDQLQPWCIVRDLPNLQRIVVVRFRRRSEAEAYLQVLRRLLPTTAHRLLFDPAMESAELLDSVQAACCLEQFEQGEGEASLQLIQSQDL